MNIINKALSEYGVKRIIGSKNNHRILKYFENLVTDSSTLEEETEWCSAFVNWVAKTTGYQYSGKLNARSWLTTGKSTKTPKVGDIVILWQDNLNSRKGHVGFFIKETKHFVYVLGGNQRDMVCIKAYNKSRVLDYKELKKINNLNK